MNNRVSIESCLLLGVLLIILSGCGNIPDRPDTVSRDPGITGTGVSENTSESTIPGSASESMEERQETNSAFPKTIVFGSYPQQNDRAEAIEWIMLEDNGERVLLLSRYCLASMPWHNSHEAVTWDESDIRAWLNGEFLETAFSEEERATILSAVLNNGDDLNYGTPDGEDTTDSVFLLSVREALHYLDIGNRTASPSAYAIRQGAYTNGSGNCAWWLRSPGMTETSPAYFASAGEIGNRAHEVNETIIGVRPAIWIKADALHPMIQG